MKRKFLLICTQLEFGGAQVKAVNLAAMLRRRGHEAEVWFLYNKRPAFTAVEESRCLLNHRPTRKFDYFRITARLNDLIRRKRPDVIVGLAHYASPLACCLALANGVQTRIATQCGPLDAFPGPARWLDLLAGTVGAYTWSVAASNGVRQTFARFPKTYRQRIRVIYDGVPLRSAAFDQLEARDLFSLPRDVPLLINIGRLSPLKNQIYAIELLEQLPGTHLAIVGDGELRTELETAIRYKGLSDRVHLLGEIDPERVPDFLRCGNIFIFPSMQEGFGLAAVEAMHMGLPVVSSNTPPLPEIIGAGGIQLPLADRGAWRDNIASLLTADERRRAMGRRAMARASIFTLERMADAYESLACGTPNSVLTSFDLESGGPIDTAVSPLSRDARDEILNSRLEWNGSARIRGDRWLR
jgi:glycosyltransferase involved in cell wall biosynthesis